MNGEIVVERELISDGHYEQIWLSRKEPVKDEQGSIAGLLGFTTLVEKRHLKVIWNEAQRQYMLYPTPEKLITLSVREFQVIKELLHGKTPAEIALSNNVSPKTIESYLHRIKVKCCLTKTREVISYLIHSDLVNAILAQA